MYEENKKDVETKCNTSQVEQLLDALAPFANAFDRIKDHNLFKDEEIQKCYDVNTITPNVNMGNFRKAWITYKKCI